MENHEALVARGRQIVQEAPQAYFDTDVEADGKPGHGSLLSVGAVSPWGDTFYAELRPTSERFIQKNRDFCEAYGLERERLLKEGQLPTTALGELTRWAIDLSNAYGKEEAVLTAFNASYDFPWVDVAMFEAGVPHPFGIAGYCIKSAAMGLPGPYDWRKTTKGRLPAELVPEGEFTHNALEDALYQQKIHFALAAKLALYNSL